MNRDAFEKWAKETMWWMPSAFEFGVTSDGYNAPSLNDAWKAWQASRAQALEEAKKVADAERAKFAEMVAQNNGRESDFAFGSVNSAERIASSIRALAQGGKK